jgi:gluconate 2-dehydrogenase gamma chain
MLRSTRRQLLAGTALIALSRTALGHTVSNKLPWKPNDVDPPAAVQPGPWLFLTGEEAEAIDAIASRLIPNDELGPGAKEAGCTVFIDRQLAGPYGNHEWLYMQGPFPANPLPSQGMQSPLTPRQQYRQGLAALAQYCRSTFDNRGFAQLSPEEQDRVLTGLEKNEIHLPGFNGRMLFTIVQTNVIEGYFADPIYGGNRDMVGWKLVGFPGTRYDYRDVMERPNQAYALPPVSLQGRPDWNGRG